MSINFVINSQLYKDSIIGAYTLFRDSIIICRVITNDLPSWEVRRILAPCRRGESPERLGDYEATPTLRPLVGRTNLYH